MLWKTSAISLRGYGIKWPGSLISPEKSKSNNIGLFSLSGQEWIYFLCAPFCCHHFSIIQASIPSSLEREYFILRFLFATLWANAKQDYGSTWEMSSSFSWLASLVSHITVSYWGLSSFLFVSTGTRGLQVKIHVDWFCNGSTERDINPETIQVKPSIQAMNTLLLCCASAVLTMQHLTAASEVPQFEWGWRWIN